jgi:two-component system nitrogen regulation response regulator NtrX
MSIKHDYPEEAGMVSIDSCDLQLPLREARERFERAYFTHLLQITGGNVSAAARLSGIARQNFYAHIKRLSIVTKS